jgi:hypothetical protein
VNPVTKTHLKYVHDKRPGSVGNSVVAVQRSSLEATAKVATTVLFESCSRWLLDGIVSSSGHAYSWRWCLLETSIKASVILTTGDHWCIVTRLDRVESSIQATVESRLEVIHQHLIIFLCLLYLFRILVEEQVHLHIPLWSVLDLTPHLQHDLGQNVVQHANSLAPLVVGGDGHVNIAKWRVSASERNGWDVDVGSLEKGLVVYPRVGHDQ